MRALVTQTALTSAATLYGALATFVVLVATARALGPEGRGVYVVVFVWTSLIGTAWSLSLNGPVLTGMTRTSEIKRRPYVATNTVALAGVFALCALLTWGVLARVPGIGLRELPYSAILAGFALVPARVWEPTGRVLLALTGRVGTLNRITMIGRTLEVAAALLFLFVFKFGAWAALAATALGNLVITISGLIQVLMDAKQRSRLRTNTMRRVAKSGLTLHANTLLGIAYSSVGTLIVQSRLGLVAAAQYQMALQLIQFSAIPATGAALSMSADIGKYGPDIAWARHRRLAIILFAGLAAAGGAAVFVGPPAIVAIFGEEFAQSAMAFTIMLPSILGIAAAAVFGPQWLSRGLFLATIVTTLLMTSATIVAVYILAGLYGVAGAALGTTIGALVGLTLNGAFWIYIEKRVVLKTKKTS